jgi:hypothetical protein
VNQAVLTPAYGDYSKGEDYGPPVGDVIYQVGTPWRPTKKMVTFSRGKAKIDVVSDRAAASVSKEAAFARRSFDAIASKVVSVGFFELPDTFASNVDGTYEVVTVHTQGLSKQVTVLPGSKPPAGLVELLEILRGAARDLDPVHFGNP